MAELNRAEVARIAESYYDSDDADRFYFKIWGGEIHAVNAFFATLPISTPRAWPSTDPLPRP